MPTVAQAPCWHDMAAVLLVTAAIDARHRTGLCWHDMAAELLVAAAIDARRRTSQRRHDMAAEFCHSHRCLPSHMPMLA